jgi:hypothetical protein
MSKIEKKHHSCHPPKSLNPNSNINQPTITSSRLKLDHIKKSLYMCPNYCSIPPHIDLQAPQDEKHSMPLSI